MHPRFTRTVSSRGVLTDKMHPNEAYEMIHNNDIRDKQIIGDVKNCVLTGRTPLFCHGTRIVRKKLYEHLKCCADHVFLMTGNNSKKEHRKILEQMHSVNKDESIILIATGSLAGEGFDFPRLDVSNIVGQKRKGGFHLRNQWFPLTGITGFHDRTGGVKLPGIFRKVTFNEA